ncbi:MAG: RNA polymerase sigma factor [Planctomycetota bacterium]
MSASAGTDDGALVAAFRAGRIGAFEAIVRRHYQGLLRVAEVRCGSGGMAEDVVQVALVRAHRYLRRARAVENLGAWLRRVVHNCANDLLRTERRDAPAPAALDSAPAPSDATLEREELRSLVRGAIEKLPPVYREPLTLCFLMGLEAREIAARLDDNLNSVKSRIARGRRELRRRLEHVLRRGGYL